MKQEVMNVLLGMAVGAMAGIAISKISKNSNLNMVINEDMLKDLFPKKPIILNPNGEDFTVATTPTKKLRNVNIIENKEVV